MPYIVREVSSAGYWDALRACGWLDALPLAEHEALRQRIDAAYEEDRDYVAYALAVTAFDLECIEGVGPDDPCSYHSVLTQLAEDSGGAFRAQDIIDRIDEEAEQVSISFVMDGAQYACVVPLEEDWFDPRVIDLINESMAASGEVVQFFPLPFSDAVARLALVTPEVWARARAAGVIPPEDYYVG